MSNFIRTNSMVAAGMAAFLWDASGFLLGLPCAAAEGPHSETAVGNALGQDAQLEMCRYLLAIARADRELAGGRSSRAEEILQQCPVAARQWEWAYLRHCCRQHVLTLTGHPEDISAVAYSRDGRRAASACSEMKEANDIEGPGGFRTSGRRVVAYDVRIWNTATGELLKALHHASQSWTTGLAFSPDGQSLAVASDHVDVWEIATREIRLSLPEASHCVQYSDDSRLLVSTKTGQAPALWDAISGAEVRTFKGHSGRVNAVALSRDGTRLASVGDVSRPGGGDDERGELKVWNAHTGVEVFTAGLRTSVQTVAFSPDGERVVAPRSPSVGTCATHLQVWDAASGKELLKLPTRDEVTSVRFSPDGSRLAAACGGVTVWDYDTATVIAIFREHPAVCLAYGPYNQQLVSGSYDKTVNLWKMGVHGARTLNPGPRSGVFRRVAFNGDGAKLAAAGGMEARVWDTVSGKELLKFQPGGHICGLAFRPDGGALATFTADHTVDVWNAVSGERLVRPAGQDSGWSSVSVNRLTFSPDGKRLASPTLGGRAVVWDATTGNIQRRLGTSFDSFSSVAFRPDGKYLAAATGGEIQLWDPITGEKVRTFTVATGSFQNLAFSANGRWLAGASSAHTVTVWDLATNKEACTLRGHTGSVLSVSFSADGKRLASAGADGNVKIWALPSGEETLTLFRDVEAVEDVAFSPDGKRLAIVGGDGTVRLSETEP